MTTTPGRSDRLVLVAVLLAGLNLRGAIAAVAPVLPQIRADLDLSPTSAGLLTTLPVLCFAGLAPAAAWLGRRLGSGTAVLAGLVTVAVGTALRAVDGSTVLLVGTFVVGAGMTVGNVLLPAVVKREFPARAGTVTGMYTGALAGGAALTVALTAPVAAAWGWRWGLSVWAVLAAGAGVVWVLAVRPRAVPVEQPRDAPSGPAVRVWREPVAWAVSALLAMQSVLYYAVTAWLPSLLGDELGLDLGAAAVAATVFQVLGIPGALLVAPLLGRWRGQSGLAVVVALAWAVVPAGLLLWPEAWPVWAVVGGLVQGAGISLAFALVVLRSADDSVVPRMSSMSQLVGYSVGAVSPLVVGVLYAATSGWAVPLIVLLGVCAALGAAGVVAGRPAAVGRNPSVGRKSGVDSP